MVRLTRDRIQRKLINAVGRAHARRLRLDGPPLAGWARFKRPNGTFLWLACTGLPRCRWTEPYAFRQADAALTPDERRQLLEEINRIAE